MPQACVQSILTNRSFIYQLWDCKYLQHLWTVIAKKILDNLTVQIPFTTFARILVDLSS